jgi:uncharacterized protein (DUF983 family)
MIEPGTVKATSVTHSPPIRWQPNRTPHAAPWVAPPLLTALGRGLTMRCPVCGEGKIFQGYLTVTPACSVCGAPLGLARADDAPPYFTIVVVGHIVIPGMLIVEKAYQPDLWIHAAIWLPLTVALCLLLLRPIKGATVGLMLKLGLMKSGTDE